MPVLVPLRSTPRAVGRLVPEGGAKGLSPMALTHCFAPGTLMRYSDERREGESGEA